MKALYKSIFFSVILVLGVTSCSKDEIPPTGPQDNAEYLVAGTYVGTWTRETVGESEVITAPGSLTFSVDSENYSNNVSVIALTVDGMDIGIDVTKPSVCNVALFSSGVFSFWNLTETNPFGTTFYGKVDTDGVVTMHYTKFLTSGWVEIEYNFTFTGVKQ